MKPKFLSGSCTSCILPERLNPRLAREGEEHLPPNSGQKPLLQPEQIAMPRCGTCLRQLGDPNLSYCDELCRKIAEEAVAQVSQYPEGQA